MRASQAPAKKATGCSSCDAVCCRLTVVLQPEDRIAAHLTTRRPDGLLVMKHDDDGWCVAMNRASSSGATARLMCRTGIARKTLLWRSGRGMRGRRGMPGLVRVEVGFLAPPKATDWC